MRRFEFVEGSSAKFWSAEVEGKIFVVLYGRLGTTGQRKEKEFASEELAQKELAKKIAEKLREGYHEVSATAVTTSGAKGAAAATPKLELPPRFTVRSLSEGVLVKQYEFAIKALHALEQSLGGRSWQVHRHHHRACRSLASIANSEIANRHELQALIERILQQSCDRKKLSLRRIFEILYTLETNAFKRAIEIWSQSKAYKNVADFLSQQINQLEDPELVLRISVLFFAQPDIGNGMTLRGWKRRWQMLSPLLEAALVRKKMTLKGFLKTMSLPMHPELSAAVKRIQYES